MSKIIRVVSLALILCGMSLANAHAENQKLEIDAETKVVDSLEAQEINYAEMNRQLGRMEGMLKNGQPMSDTLSEDVKILSSTRTKLLEAKKRNEKELEFVQRRIEALGPEPTDGSQEIDIIAQKRKEFNEEAAYQKGQIAEVDVLLAKIDELDTLIINVRNTELLGNLLTYQKPLIYPSNFFHATTLFVEYAVDIIKSPLNWYQGLNEDQKNFVHSNIIPVLLVAL